MDERDARNGKHAARRAVAQYIGMPTPDAPATTGMTVGHWGDSGEPGLVAPEDA